MARTTEAHINQRVSDAPRTWARKEGANLSKTISQRNPRTVLERFLECLCGVVPFGEGYRALCPGHADSRPSLTIKIGRSGLLLKCWVGCSFETICRAIGLAPSALFFDTPRDRSFPKNAPLVEGPLRPYRWNWRKRLNALVIMSEMQWVAAEDFLERAKTIDRATPTEDILLAEKWAELGRNMAGLAYELSHILRQQEGRP